MSRCQHLTAYIDERIKEVRGTVKHPDQGLRHHLGASIIGRPCKRALWYDLRWATDERHGGQLLRLFDRGHEEEERFVDWLACAGAEVLRYNPVTGKQYRFTGVNGHFGGSIDGVARRVPYQVENLTCNFEDWIGVEFKTHNDKSFSKLVQENVKVSKPEHYAQFILYIDEFKLPGGVYGAVNKNTDELYWEYVLPDPQHAEGLRYKAMEIVYSKQPPPRISNSPSWWTCKYCTHRQVCHFGVAMSKSCRTCVSAIPTDNGRWLCERFGKLIPTDFEEVGCDNWKQITD